MTTNETLPRRGRVAACVIAVVVLAAAMTVGDLRPVAASPSAEPARKPAPDHGDVHRGGELRPDTAQRARRGHFTNTNRVGEIRTWPALEGDDFYLKDFRMRGLGAHVEVWVAEGDDVSAGLDFPPGDCRNGDRTRVTDAQIAYLVDEFERKILPSETALFGHMANRNGREATLPRLNVGVPANTYRGPGNRLVVLVDNFRVEGFWAPADQAPYWGFVASVQMELTGRNVLNLSGVDWDWFLGLEPRSPEPADAGPCEATWAAPSFYEYVFNHEYVHVLQSRYDPSFTDPSWIVEGVAQWGAQLPGHLDLASDAPNNILQRCFQGFVDFCPGGPENSMTAWGDHAAPGVDYGAASSFVALLADRFGDEIVADLLQSPPLPLTDYYAPPYQGLKLERALRARGHQDTFADLVSDWAAAVALDGAIDDGAVLLGGDADRYQVDGLHSAVNWANPFTNQGYGVVPNASDYVRLRGGDGAWLDAASLDAVSFDGPTEIDCSDCSWSVDPDGHGAGNPSLWSGRLNSQNRAAAFVVDVPFENPSLDYATRFDLEPGWDFGFVQVSDDGGSTWESLATSRTTTDHHELADRAIVADLPGYTADSGGWVNEHVDLSRWAGQRVQVAFRYRSDPAVNGGGFWVDDVTVGGVLVSDGSTLDNSVRISPPVERLDVRLVSFTPDGSVASVADLPLDGQNDVTLEGPALKALIAPGANTVAVIVTHLRSDHIISPVVYALRADGVLQPGGGTDSPLP